MDNTPRETPLNNWAASRSACALNSGMSCVVILLVLVVFSACPVSTADAAGVEAKVKSAYLYNLLRRTTWPESTFKNEESPYLVTVLGQDNLEGLLDKIASKKKVNKRAIKLIRIKSIKDLQPCHMLYVPNYLTPEQQQAILKKTAGTPCLVVGDSPGFARAGATANFVDREDGTVGIVLNVAQARKHHLKFDRQLLEVAEATSE